MKKTISFLIATIVTSVSIGQEVSQIIGGSYNPNPQKINCLTPQDYERYHTQVETNIETLRSQGKLQTFNRSQITNFDWPVKQADGFEYNNVWAISNYVDHNPATNALSDYDCGTRTYDTSSGYDHQGIDIFTWPFTWKMQDEGQAVVIAAAAGQIVFKSDGNPDRSCDFNNNQWNAIYVQHSDGSVAWYGHMKNGGLTAKGVGDMVSQGEFLGVVASSGNSTGPHLHLEVYDANNQLIDPYAGPCNNLNSESWWNNQKPYLNTGINAALTHSAAPDFNFDECGITEVSFEENNFDPGATVIFGAYYIDQVPGTTAVNTILDPSGNVYTTWNNNFQQNFQASYWLGQVQVSSQQGDWTYRIQYNGETVNHTFRVGVLGVSEIEKLQVTAFPNPSSNFSLLKSAQPFNNIAVYDVQGKLLNNFSMPETQEYQLDMSSYSTGMYFLKVSSDSTTETLQMVKM